MYVRQSTADQVLRNHESRRRQYGLADRARDLGWQKVCLTWALDWRWKSFAGRVGSNRESEATARGDAVERRQTRRREAVWGRSPRRTVAPNESEPLSKPDRPGQRVFERDAQNPIEAGAVMGAGVAGHSVFLLREIHVQQFSMRPSRK
jgi:hypothetical protein